jgi:hypothetical protein
VDNALEKTRFIFFTPGTNTPVYPEKIRNLVYLHGCVITGISRKQWLQH